MATARLIVNLDRLPEEGARLCDVLDGEVLELEDAAGLHTPAGGLHYNLHVQRLGDELLVRGAVWQDFDCLCVRCARSFDWQGREPALTVAIALEEESAMVDLTAEVREAILLALPAHPLCSQACLGLCARCGADLNHGACGCPPAVDPRWGALAGDVG